MYLIINISPVRDAFSVHFPECSEQDIVSAIMAQVVKTHFQSESDWVNDNSSEMMITYIDNVFSCGREKAVAVWRDMIDAFINKLLNVDQNLFGVKNVPKTYRHISEDSIIIEY